MADQEEVDNEHDRRLDNAPTSSMDIQALNNVTRGRKEINVDKAKSPSGKMLKQEIGLEDLTTENVINATLWQDASLHYITEGMILKIHDSKISKSDFDNQLEINVNYSDNVVVVSLRGLMKRVQLFTIQKLVRQSKQLRCKKGITENQKKQKKAERLVQEVGAIKDVKIDHAIKYALGNTKTFEEVAAKGDLDTRAKVRLATHPLMVEKVKSWRGDHEDWKALAAFMLYKNTGRRYKKKKKKDKDNNPTEDSTSIEKPAKVSRKPKSKDEEGKESMPSKSKLAVHKIGDGASAKELARKAKTARNRQNHSETENIRDDGNSKSADTTIAAVHPARTKVDSNKRNTEDEDSMSVASEELNSSVVTEEKRDDEEDDRSLETKVEVVDESDDSDESDELSETEHIEKDQKHDRNDKDKTVQRVTEDAIDSESESSEEESDTGESDNESLGDKEDKKMKMKSTKQTQVTSKEVTQTVKLKPKPKPIGYKAGKDMAIKKIDLTSLTEDVEDILVESDVSFLFTASKADDIPKPKPKRKDTFFAMDSDEEEDEDDKEETTKDHVRRKDIISYDNDVGMQRKLHHKKIESAFVDRLSDKQAKGDWGYGKGSFSMAPPDEQGPWGRGRGRGRGMDSGGVSSKRGRGQAGYIQSGQNSTGYGRGGGSNSSGSTGSRGPQTKGEQPPERTNHGTEDGKLHPSWEAKRKRKELESKIVEFKGKKIKFDD